MRQLAIVLLVLLVACGDDGGGSPPIDAKVADARVVDGPGIDSPPPIDAPATVLAVSCPNGQLPLVTAPGHFYMPMTTTISVGEVVEFRMPAEHNVVPHPVLSTDPGMRVGFSQTVCLQFSTAGTFNFQCSPHGFEGSVVVQ